MPVGQTNYPTALDSHTGSSPIGFSRAENNEYSTLAIPLGAADLSITLSPSISIANWPNAGLVSVDTEVIAYSAKSDVAHTLTVSARGADGTISAAHNLGRPVALVPTAAHHNDLAAAIVALQTKLGIGASTPVANRVLRGTGAGSATWGQVVPGDVTPGSANTVLRSTGAAAEWAKVADADLVNPKVSKTGDTMTGPLSLAGGGYIDSTASSVVMAWLMKGTGVVGDSSGIRVASKDIAVFLSDTTHRHTVQHAGYASPHYEVWDDYNATSKHGSLPHASASEIMAADYGVKQDARIVDDPVGRPFWWVKVTAGSATLFTERDTFVGGDAGRTIHISGGSSSGDGLHITTISVVNSPRQVTLAAAPSRTSHFVKARFAATYGGSISAGTNILTVNGGSPNFTTADIGKTICVSGAKLNALNALDDVLVTTIASVTSTSVVVLAANATRTARNDRVVWGTDNTAELQAAIDAGEALGGRPVRLGTNGYAGISSALKFSSHSGLVGVGADACGIILMGNPATNKMMQSGGFGYNSITPSGRADPIRLSGAINASATTITVNYMQTSLGGSVFHPSGAIMIDDELIKYTGVDVSAGVGGPHSFTGCTRGIHGTVAASHTINTNVGLAFVTGYTSDGVAFKEKYAGSAHNFITFRDLSLDGNRSQMHPYSYWHTSIGVASPYNGAEFSLTNHLLFDRVRIHSVTSHGIALHKCYYATVRKTVVQSLGGTGIWFGWITSAGSAANYTQYSRVTDCVLLECGTDGYETHTNNTIESSVCSANGLEFTNQEPPAEASNIYILDAGTGNWFIDNYVDLSSASGIDIGRECNFNRAIGNVITNNKQAGIGIAGSHNLILSNVCSFNGTLYLNPYSQWQNYIRDGIALFQLDPNLSYNNIVAHNVCFANGRFGIAIHKSQTARSNPLWYTLFDTPVEKNIIAHNQLAANGQIVGAGSISSLNDGGFPLTTYAHVYGSALMVAFGSENNQIDGNVAGPEENLPIRNLNAYSVEWRNIQPSLLTPRLVTFLIGAEFAGMYNTIVQQGDRAMIYHTGAADSGSYGGFVIAPWSGTGRGFRMSHDGLAEFTTQLHLNSGALVGLKITGAGNTAASAGAATGTYLIVNVAGVDRKIALLAT